MAGEKRKASSSAGGERSSKKPATGKVQVSHLEVPDGARPVIGTCPYLASSGRHRGLTVGTATTPGIQLPSKISFRAYSKEKTDGTTSLLLQSSDHPTIDYVATESSTMDAAEQHMEHYLAVYNPETNKLNVLPARQMTVKSTIRTRDNEDDEDEEDGPPMPATPSSRAALTQAFGTKKSKKAVASIAENRLLARNNQADDPVSAAILASIDEAESADEGDTHADIEAARANKPLPSFNPHATSITEVYPLSSLVYPAPWETTLSQMQVSFWKDYTAKNQPIKTSYRFIATHLSYIPAAHLHDPEDTSALQALQLLRYILLLLEISKFISQQPERRPIPPVDKWPPKTTSDSSLSTTFKARLLEHFFPTNLPTPSAKTLLTSTILALTLHIPPPKPSPNPSFLFSDTSEITLDLALRAEEIQKLYRELGCKLERLTEPELKSSGWGRVKPASGPKIDPETGKPVKSSTQQRVAKLKFPIEFPKMSSGRPGQKRAR
jgi:DNA-directed RNA polymerase I subunit RPA49